MSGQRLSMIGKSATTRKVSINEAKQEFLTQGGINRYGGPKVSPTSPLCPVYRTNSHRWRRGKVYLLIPHA